MKQVVFVLAEYNFRDEEYFDTLEQIKHYGYSHKVASLHQEICHSKLGKEVPSDLSLIDVNPELFDAIILIGGTGASEFFHNVEAHHLVQDFYNQKKIVSAICIAPRILAEAGILKGKKVTSFETEKDAIIAKGGIWVDKPTEKDGLIITANGPDSATEFGKLIIDTIEEI